jgi:hypothetical protein
MFALRVAIKEAHAGEVSQVTPGVFHHLDQLNVDIFHHRSIHLDHLLGGHVCDSVRIYGNRSIHAFSSLWRALCQSMFLKHREEKGAIVRTLLLGCSSP